MEIREDVFSSLPFSYPARMHGIILGPPTTIQELTEEFFFNRVFANAYTHVDY